MDATERQPATGRQGRRWPWLSLLLLAGVILGYVAIVGGPRGGPQGTEGPAIGRRVPYFQLESLTGDSRNVVEADLLGRVTLVNYWGTWCPPCRREFPDIVELAARFAAHSDFSLYAVSCGDEGSDADLAELRAETQEFLDSRMVKLPTYGDQNAQSRRAMLLALGMEHSGFAYPTTIVFDQQAIIRGFWQGYDPRAAREMASLIETLLDKPAGGSTSIQPASASSNTAAAAEGSPAPATAP